jgi:DNA-binding CsgD family transcriptional regulator
VRRTVNDEQYEELMAKLNLICQLLALTILREAKTKKEIIVKLAGMGLRPFQIQRLMNLKGGTVRTTLRREKKTSKTTENTTTDNADQQ